MVPEPELKNLALDWTREEYYLYDDYLMALKVDISKEVLEELVHSVKDMVSITNIYLT